MPDRVGLAMLLQSFRRSAMFLARDRVNLSVPAVGQGFPPLATTEPGCMQEAGLLRMLLRRSAITRCSLGGAKRPGTKGHLQASTVGLADKGGWTLVA